MFRHGRPYWNKRLVPLDNWDVTIWQELNLIGTQNLNMLYLSAIIFFHSEYQWYQWLLYGSNRFFGTMYYRNAVRNSRSSRNIDWRPNFTASCFCYCFFPRLCDGPLLHSCTTIHFAWLNAIIRPWYFFHKDIWSANEVANFFWIQITRG